MKRRLGNLVVVAQLALAVGCAGTQKGGETAKTANDVKENAPAPPSEEAIKQHAAEAKKAPAPQVSADEKADFEGAMKKWEAAKKQNTVTADCRGIAGAFSSVAGSHKNLAAQAHFNAGTVLDSCGQTKEAEQEYQAALAANPAYGPALGNLGEMYYRQGNPQRAKEWFEKAIAADPTHNAPAYNNLALIYFNQAKDGNPSLYKEAVSKLRRALAIDPDSMPAYALLALIYYTTAENDRSKLQLAELVCDQAKHSNDRYAPIYNTNGLILLRRRNVTGALKEFEKAIDIDPKYVEAHLNIGAIGLSSRQYEKAQRSFDEVLKLQPNNVDATIGLGVALRGQRKIEEAEKMYKKAAELDPKNCAIPYNLGVLYQDYKNDPANANLNDAKGFYRQYTSCGKTDKTKVADAERRMKDIDDTFTAIAEQKKMEAELAKQQEEMQKQQKQMEEQQKLQEQQQKKPDGPPAAAAEPAPKAQK